MRRLVPWLLAALTAGAFAQGDGFVARATALASPTVLLLEDGRRIRLQGLSLPSAAVRTDRCEGRLREFVAARTVGRTVEIVLDAGGDEPGAELVALVRGEGASVSVNEEALDAGVALLSCRTARVAALEALRTAARRAQAQRRGWFRDTPAPLSGELPFLNGAVLGLYSKDASYDYSQQLGELAAAGFRHVCLLFTALLADVEASRIERHGPRTVTDRRLIETIARARGLGMTVMLMPVVLLERAADDDWRGTLRPKDEAAFWLEYDAFLDHYLDIAQASGAQCVSIGSELGSLEDRTETWRRLIHNARGRFTGWLTYSANWDHAHVPRFFGQLDFVGLTGYFGLTDSSTPSPAELVAAWRRIGGELRSVVGKLGKPVVITELGYASQDGINRDPWNYTMARDAVDLDEQAHCFAAFLAVAPELEFLHGAYFFDYFEAGGPGDPGYSPRGKPAFAHWQRWAAYAPALSAGGR